MAYLRSVRWEAASIPGVSRAALDPLQFESRRTAYTPRTASFQPPPAGAEVRSGSRAAAASRAPLTRARAGEAGVAAGVCLALFGACALRQLSHRRLRSHSLQALRSGLQTAASAQCGRLGSGDSAHQPLDASNDSGYAGASLRAGAAGARADSRPLAQGRTTLPPGQLTSPPSGSCNAWTRCPLCGVCTPASTAWMGRRGSGAPRLRPAHDCSLTAPLCSRDQALWLFALLVRGAPPAWSAGHRPLS